MKKTVLKITIVFTTLSCIASCSNSQTSEKYKESGDSKNKNNDLLGAIADYPKSIELDQKNVYVRK